MFHSSPFIFTFLLVEFAAVHDSATLAQGSLDNIVLAPHTGSYDLRRWEGEGYGSGAVCLMELVAGAESCVQSFISSNYS